MNKAVTSKDIVQPLSCRKCGTDAVVSDLPDGSLRVICPVCYRYDVFKDKT